MDGKEQNQQLRIDMTGLPSAPPHSRAHTLNPQDLAAKRNGLAQIEEVLSAKIVASQRQQQLDKQQPQRKAVKAG